MTAGGIFITFEGIDGAGKSTHLDGLAQLFRDHGRRVTLTREPGGTPLAEQLRTLVLNDPMDAMTEALLVFAGRRDHLQQCIEPALARGDVVLCDRFTDATFAYQGGGRGLSVDKLNALEQWVHPHLQPDLTFLFDVPLEVARARLDATRTLDKFEQENTDFFANTRAEYLRRAQEFPQRFRVIDSTQKIECIQKEISAFLDVLNPASKESGV